MQKTNYPANDAVAAYGGRALLPQGETWTKPYSRAKYGWSPPTNPLTYAKAADGSPYDGILMNYVNPVTGGPVMQTIGAGSQITAPGAG